MPVISISLGDDLLQDVDDEIASGGYTGRSEFIRTAIRSHLKPRKSPKGHVHGSVTITYPHGNESRISDIRHAFHDVVLSLMHTHCEPDTCLDVLIVGGPAARVQELHATFERTRIVSRSRLALVA